MVGSMRYILRPSAGTLALASTEGESGKLLTYALPDAEFWSWLHSSGIYAEMVAENPARMKRVESAKIGVFAFRSEKSIITSAGYTNKTLASARPQADAGKPRPVLIATVKAAMKLQEK